MVEDLRNFFLGTRTHVPTLFSSHAHSDVLVYPGTVTRSTCSIADSYLARRRVVNTNCRSVIGFFGRVVGPLPGYRDVQHSLELWLCQTSGTHPRRILENPRACLVHTAYTRVGITDARCRHDAGYLGLGISRYRSARARALRPNRVQFVASV